MSIREVYKFHPKRMSGIAFRPDGDACIRDWNGHCIEIFEDEMRTLYRILKHKYETV